MDGPVDEKGLPIDEMDFGNLEDFSLIPSDILRESAALFDRRRAEYGDNYKRVGELIASIMPDGIYLSTVEDFQRFHVFVMMVVKLTRYAENFTRGGHEDSLTDLSVYAAMLEHLDAESRKGKQ